VIFPVTTFALSAYDISMFALAISSGCSLWQRRYIPFFFHSTISGHALAAGLLDAVLMGRRGEFLVLCFLGNNPRQPR